MAGTDVQIRIIGRDDATGSFQRVAREAENTQQKMESLGNSLFSVQSVLRNTAAYASAIAGLNGITEALHSAVDSALEFYTTMQTGSISLAGSLMSMGQINGEAIQWNEALGMSKTLMRELSDQALVTGASTKEISEVFRGMLPSALNAKMTIEQTMKLASAFTTTGKAMGIDGNILSRDVRDIINGRNVERTTLGMQLGLTNEDIQQAKQSAEGLFSFLSERLRGEMEANGHYLETFEGRWNHLKESISRVGGEALTPFIQEATDEIGNLANKLVSVDMDNGKVTGINGDVIESIQNGAIVIEHFGSGIVEVARDLSGVFTPALNIAAGVIEVAAEHTTLLTESMLALWVGRKISYYVNDYRNALTGAAEAQTFLGRAAEQARVQIEAEANAQRQANMQQVRSGMTALSNTTSTVISAGSQEATNQAVARQIALEKSLGNEIRNNIELEVKRSAAAQTTRTVFETALAAMKAGEMELATQILETSASLEAQGTTAEMMASRANQAILLIKAGEAELAEQIVSTTLETELQGVQGLEAGAKSAEGAAIASEAQTVLRARTVETNVATIATGTAAAASGARVVSMGAVAGNAIRNLISLAWSLVGGWVGVAAAIGVALYKLYEYATAERDWEQNHTYWYNGSSWVVDRAGNVKRNDTNVPEVSDWTGVGAGWDEVSQDDIDAVKKLNAEHEEELKKQQEEQEKQDRIASMEKEKRIIGEIANERPDLLNQVTSRYSGDGEGDKEDAKAATKEETKAQREAAQAAREQAQANKEYANVIAENSRKIAQANEKVANIIESLNEKILNLTGTQLQIDLDKISRDVSHVSKEIANSIVTLKTFTPKSGSGGASDGYSIEQNWKENLLSGDDAITTLTAQKLHLLSEKYYELTGEQPTVTSMHRYGDRSSWHDSGQAFDLSDSNLENNADLRHQLADYARTIGLNPLDEYETPDDPATGTHWGDNNVHFTDNGTPLPELPAQPAAPVQPTVSQESVTIPQTPQIQTIEQTAAEMNATDLLKILLAIATYESGDQKNVATIGSNTYNSSSGAAGMFQILPGQDYLGEDGQRHYIPDDYADNDKQNTIAAIDLLRGKIREQNGDVWAGVKHYGENTDEYVNGVRAIYDSLGGDNINLAPMGTTTYKPPQMGEAYKKLSEYQKEAIKDVMEKWQQRRAQYADETSITAAELGMNGDNYDNRLVALQRNLDKTLREIDQKRKDVYKNVVGKGDDAEGQELVEQYQNVQKEKARQEELQKECELMTTEHNERQTHLQSMGYLQEEYASTINKYQAQELEQFIRYQKELLDTAKLTQEQRIKMEQELYENMEKLHTLEAKTDWGAGMEQLGRGMKSYTQDIGTALTQGWSSVTDTIEGTFDNMLTSNQSFSERMRNMYISVANTILNTMMKIIMQGLIMHTIMQACGMGVSTGLSGDITSNAISMLSGGLSFGGGASLPTSYAYHHSITGFASGGFVSPGYFIAGEEGRELVEMTGNGYVHNARETAEILNPGNNQQGSGIENVEVRIVNQSGQQVKSSQAEAQVDGKKLIVTTMLEAVATDYMGSRSLLKGALGNG